MWRGCGKRNRMALVKLPRLKSPASDHFAMCHLGDWSMNMNKQFRQARMCRLRRMLIGLLCSLPIRLTHANGAVTPENKSPYSSDDPLYSAGFPGGSVPPFLREAPKVNASSSGALKLATKTSANRGEPSAVLLSITPVPGYLTKSPAANSDLGSDGIRRLQGHSDKKRAMMSIHMKKQCLYAIDNSKFAATRFAVGTSTCKGLSECQFVSLEAALGFCDGMVDCTVVLKHPGGAASCGEDGCFTPRGGILIANPSWKKVGGQTFVKSACQKQVATHHVVLQATTPFTTSSKPVRKTNSTTTTSTTTPGKAKPYNSWWLEILFGYSGRQIGRWFSTQALPREHQFPFVVFCILSTCSVLGLFPMCPTRQVCAAAKSAINFISALLRTPPVQFDEESDQDV